jgi:uncharacterized membrane protein
MLTKEQKKQHCKEERENKMLTKEEKEYRCKEVSMALAFIVVPLIIILFGETVFWIIWITSVVLNFWIFSKPYLERPKENLLYMAVFFVGLGPVTLLILLFQTILWKHMVVK